MVPYDGVFSCTLESKPLLLPPIMHETEFSDVYYIASVCKCQAISLLGGDDLKGKVNEWVQHKCLLSISLNQSVI